MVSHLRIFIFTPNFATKQIQGRWFQVWQYFFQIPVQRYSNKAFLVPNLEIFVFFHKKLQLEKFEGADFKYGNSFCKIPAHTHMRHFWSQIWAISLFHEILQLDQFQGADFKHNIIFKLQPKNSQISYLWSQI